MKRTCWILATILAAMIACVIWLAWPRPSVTFNFLDGAPERRGFILRNPSHSRYGDRAYLFEADVQSVCRRARDELAPLGWKWRTAGPEPAPREGGCLYKGDSSIWIVRGDALISLAQPKSRYVSVVVYLGHIPETPMEGFMRWLGETLRLRPRERV